MSFVNKIIRLFVGAAVGKAVQLACLPVISRFFSAEELGVYGSMLAIAAIVSVFIGLRLEIDYVAAAEREREKVISTFLSCSLVSSLAVLGLAYLGVFDSWIISQSVGYTSVSYLIFVLLVCSLSIYDFGLVVLAAESKITRLAITRSLAGGGTGVAQVLLGVLGFASSASLVLSDIFARLLTSADIIRKWKMSEFSIVFLLSMQRFWVVTSAFLNRLSNNLPYIAIGYLFGASSVGFYFLTQRALGGVNVLLGQAISSAFLSDIAFKLQKREDMAGIWEEIIRLVLKSAVFSAPYFLVAGVAGYFFIDRMFGSEWREFDLAWLCITIIYFVQFVFSPISQVLNFIGRSDVQSLWELSRFFILLVALLFTGYFLSFDLYQCLLIMSAVYLASYSILLGLIKFFISNHKY